MAAIAIGTTLLGAGLAWLLEGILLFKADPPQEWDSDQPEFIEDEPFYSSQGAAGTCVRHAIAKSIQGDVIENSENKIGLHTITLVQWLVDELGKRGAEGSNPMEFDGASGTVVGQGGYIFDLSIKINMAEDKPAKHHVAGIDMGKCDLNISKAYSKHTMHVLFCESCNDGEATLRNSWGRTCEYIKLTDDHPAWVACWDVKVQDFTWRGYGERPDIILCQGGKWNTDVGEWPEY